MRLLAQADPSLGLLVSGGMDQGLPRTLVSLGLILFLGLLADTVGRRTAVPRVTLLLLLGIAIGPGGLDLIPGSEAQWFAYVAPVALVMVGFLIGGQLTRRALRAHGRWVVGISVVVLLVTAASVTTGALLVGAPLTLAVLLGSIAGATDPAACADVVHEGSADGPFARTLLGIVAIDDAWGLIAFVVALAVADAIAGGGGVTTAIGDGAWELGGAILVGAALGLPLAYLTGRLRPGEPTLLEALGAVFVCCGVAMLLHVTYLLAAMVMGMVVGNLARHHRRPFHAIEGIEWPAMVLFFVLAGASLHLATLAQIGWIGAAYVVLRIVGRLVGGWAGARLSGAPVAMQRWMGLALLPQAGVALGMALLASERFPELRQTILPVTIAATVLFELSGPVLTRLALVRAGEMRSKRP